MNVKSRLDRRWLICLLRATKARIPLLLACAAAFLPSFAEATIYRLTVSGVIWQRTDLPGIPLPVAGSPGMQYQIYWDIDDSITPVVGSDHYLLWNAVRRFGIYTQGAFTGYRDTGNNYVGIYAESTRTYYNLQGNYRVPSDNVSYGAYMLLMGPSTLSLSDVGKLDPRPLSQWTNVDETYAVFSSCPIAGGGCSGIWGNISAITFRALPPPELVTYDFTVTATDGPLVGQSGSGSFAYDRSIVPDGFSILMGTGLISNLAFSWNGINYDESSANSGSIVFDSNGALYNVLFGTKCGTGWCGNFLAATENWYVSTPSQFGYSTVGGGSGSGTLSWSRSGSSALRSLSLSSAVIAGCKNVRATVALTNAAPAGGLVLNVSDTLASATPPVTVTIPEGASSKSFTIKTVPVASNQNGTVTVSLGGASLSQPLTIRPMGLSAVKLSPTTVVGGQNATGTATLECDAGPGPVTVDLSTSNAAVAHPVATTVVVPQGLKSQTFTVATNPVLSKSSAMITGEASTTTKSRRLNVVPAAVVSPTRLAFGSVSVGQTSAAMVATLRNDGLVSFAVNSISLTGSYASWYSQTNNCPANLAAGASCTITVRFRPQAALSKSAKLSIATSATSTPLSVSLSGTGI